MQSWLLQLIELLKKDQSIIHSLEDILEEQESKHFSSVGSEVTAVE